MSDAIVILPTYNEVDNIENMVDAIFSLEKKFHILVVDDNSPDGTHKKVNFLQITHRDNLFLLKREQKQGLGKAYLDGFSWALENKYEYVFEMDADFSHNPKDLIRLYNTCKNGGADLAIGSRYVKGINVVNWPIERVLLSYLASLYVRLVTGMPIHDATAGYKCYKRHVLESINFEKINFVGYAFQIEMKYKAYIKKFKLIEIPVVFRDRVIGTSKMSSNIIKEAVFGVIKLKLESIFNKKEI